MTSNSKRTWLVTGCDKGMGYAIAQAALEHGHDVIATVLAPDGRCALSADYPDRLRSFHLDVTNRDAVWRLIEEVERTSSGIDVLVNNAGFGLVGAAEETVPEEYRKMFEVNFFGMAEMTRAVLAGMRNRRRGHIINISSLVGMVGASGFSFYSASKFAVEGFSEGLAKEVDPLGLKVTIIEPGGFRTDFAGGSLARAKTIIDDYSATSGATRDYLTARHGAQPGDPAKLGAVLCQLVDMEKPPLRLALGGDALQQVEQKAEFLSREINRWRDLSLSTSFRD